jgi:membrane-bound lytic murein transglycosylase A
MIKGPGRVDLYCGTGDEAEMLAGSLKERGDLYFLVKKKDQ